MLIEKEQVGGLIGKVSTVTHYSALVEPETGETFAERLKSQALGAGVKIVDEEVLSVTLESDIKEIVTNKDYYQSRTVIPVSYTHLDVYKRQGLSVFTAPLCSWASEGG